MTRRVRSLWVGVAVFMAAVFLFASMATAGKKDDTLNIALEKELESLDWYFNTAREGIVFARHVYDHLIYRDPETQEYKPLLAKSWQWIDNTTLEMELRDNVTFHNGAKFSADDVVYMFNWISNPDNKVKQQRYVNWIKECVKTRRLQDSNPLERALPRRAGIPLMCGPHLSQGLLRGSRP